MMYTLEKEKEKEKAEKERVEKEKLVAALTAQLDTITKKFNILVPRPIIGIYFICVYY